MIQIKEIVNSLFTSKTYILYKEDENKSWIVDIGDVKPGCHGVSDIKKNNVSTYKDTCHVSHDNHQVLVSIIRRMPRGVVHRKNTFMRMLF